MEHASLFTGPPNYATQTHRFCLRSDFPLWPAGNGRSGPLPYAMHVSFQAETAPKCLYLQVVGARTAPAAVAKCRDGCVHFATSPPRHQGISKKAWKLEQRYHKLFKTFTKKKTRVRCSTRRPARLAPAERFHGFHSVWPSQRAMTAVARQFPSTFTDVLAMSSTASIPSRTATPSSGS